MGISDQRQRPRTIVLIAGRKSHGPEGNGVHDYGWDARVAHAMLLRSNIGDRVRVRHHLDGWPADPRALDDADAVVVMSDGRDGDAYAEALHLAGDARVAEVERLMRRGCGLAVIHFATFAPQRLAEQALRWCGAYFQWQGNDGARAWTSAITTIEAPVELSDPGHAVCRGVAPFRLREEFYHALTFAPNDVRLTPLLRVPALPAGSAGRGDVVAWAREREDGSRGFGTTLGHFHDNWRLADYRTLLLNGISWAAGVEIPAEGVRAPWLSRDQACAAIRERDDDSLRVLLLAGNQAHRWHNWETTTPAMRAALERDSRIRVEVTGDPQRLANLDGIDAVVLNYCNWEDPVGISAAARESLERFVASGGGLVVAHFANGAFHRSLPKAGASDWPGYRRLVRRVWDHAADSAHDDYGWFTARPTAVEHPVTQGLSSFAVEDELYVRQRGDEPIEPLLVARSRVTGGDEPLAWSYSYAEGRVFQTLLGHSERTYDAFAAREMLRRAVAWAAGREVRMLTPEFDSCASPARVEEAVR